MKNRFSWLGVYLLLAWILLLEVIEMPQFSDGQKISEALVWNRLIESIPASYVVWKDGDTYRAECLLKDGTDYSGTDMGVVLQSARDALPNYYSGTILIKAGLYIAKTKVTIPNDSHLKIMGEGMHNTIIRWDTTETWNESVGAITYSSDKFVQDAPFTVAGQELSGLGLSANLQLEDLTLWINDPNLTGLYIKNLARLSMKNVRIKGYYTESYPPGTPSTSGIYLESTMNDMFKFDNVVISGFCRGVFHSADHSHYNLLEIGLVQDGFVFSDGFGVVLTRPHIYKYSATAYGFQRNAVSTGMLIEPRAESAATGASGFYVASSGSDVYVDVYGATVGSETFASGSYDLLRFRGHGYENRGTATFSGNGSNKVFTIPHGLDAAPLYCIPFPAVAPTFVDVQPASTDAKGDYYITADATNITVTYGTAPASGTNNVVLRWIATR